MNRILKVAIGAIAVSVLVGCQSVPPPLPAGPHEGAPVLAVEVTPTAPSSESLAQKLRIGLEGGATKRGFAISTKLPPDVTVNVALLRFEKARLQEWRTYDGEARVSVMTAADGNIIGTTRIVVTGARGSDERAAEESLAGALNAKVDGWLARILRAERIVKLPVPGN